jgi:hypothetical protein
MKTVLKVSRAGAAARRTARNNETVQGSEHRATQQMRRAVTFNQFSENKK